VHTDEGAAPAAPPRRGPRALAALAAALLTLLTLLVLSPAVAGGGPGAQAAVASRVEWLAGEQGLEGETGVLESGSPRAPEATSEREPAPEGEAPPEPAPLASAPQTGPIIGTNDAAGWGPRAASRILGGGVRWNRVELGTSTPNSLQASLKDRFKVLAVAGNIGDSRPLSSVDPHEWGAGVLSELRGRPGIALAEAGNEMYLKGGTANPVQYGRMYLAAVEALRGAGLRMPLLFDMTGDYPSGGGWSSPRGWSTDAGGGGWLRTAVSGVPGLAPAIAANGIAIHPYGAIGENSHDDFGTAAVSAEESAARAVLGRMPPVYITEFGYDLGRCGRTLGACSKNDQAAKMRAAYNVFLADPNVLGIWWYQSHDDGTGEWGFMDGSSTARPSFRTLSSLAHLAGQ
jgi:hypothetical protein